jgi:hypothetical protein
MFAHLTYVFFSDFEYREYLYELKIVLNRGACAINTGENPLQVEIWCLSENEADNLICHKTFLASISINGYIREGVAFSKLWNDIISICGECRLNIVHHSLSMTPSIQSAQTMVNNLDNIYHYFLITFHVTGFADEPRG